MRPAELPGFEATWWPVKLETVPGSGESLTIAIVARARSGQSQVRQLIPPAAVGAMFGQAGSGMKVVVVQTCLALQKQLDEGVSVDKLSMPFGGAALGGPRDCVATDFNEVFEVAFRLGGAFGISGFGSVEKPSEETRRAFDEWADKVRLELLSFVSTSDLTNAFNVPVQLVGRRGRIGFVRDSYAANFGVLRPGRPASSDVRALKVKIFDLEALRHSSPLLSRHTEVLVGYPDIPTGGAFSRRELDTQRESWEFIDFEARQRGVKALRYGVAREAAVHLEAMASAHARA
jgi:hypothetical protein